MNRYRRIMGSIHLSERVKANVLASAGAMKRKSPVGMVLLRRAVCVVCALTLVLGSFSLRWERKPTGNPAGSGSGEIPGTNLVLSYEFGIVASAVEHAANDSLILRWEDGCCGFRIAGGEIVSVALETNRGVLLRNGQPAGVQIEETFDPDTVYGIAPADGETLESLDGMELVLEVSFADGVQKSESYYLTLEELRGFVGEDGNEVLVPTLEGDPGEKISALYGAGDGSRWLSWPVKGSNTVRLSMPYGERESVNETRLFHSGIDIPGTAGMEILSVGEGVVREADYDSTQGNYLVVDYGTGMTVLYAHCQVLLAKQGQQVSDGECIALMGATGMSTGPHLHFEVRQDGVAQNPVAYFNSTVRDTLRTE